MPLPRITFAFLSWNRLNYLRPTIASARDCIQYPNLEWIVSDNDSDEPGIKDYLASLGWVDHVIVKSQSHPSAMNEIVQKATGKYLVLWPDDMQFIVKGPWLEDIVELLESNLWIGSVSLNAFRRATLNTLFERTLFPEIWDIWTEFRRFGHGFRRQQKLISRRGFGIHTVGRRMPGVFGCGIPGLTRKDIWKTLGPWREKHEGIELRDSSMGAEGDMNSRFYGSGIPLQTALLDIPVAADIITDPLGCKAKVRKNLRYGVYMPPPDTTGYYYRIHDQQNLMPLAAGGHILDFAQIVEPLGFSIPTDGNGDHLKTSINTSVVFNCQTGQPVPFPLQTIQK